MQSGDSSLAAAMPGDGEHDAAAEISAELMQASTSSDASQTDVALSALSAQLMGGGGWPLGVGEGDVLAAALDAMHRHESDPSVQRSGVYLVYQLLTKMPPLSTLVPKSFHAFLTPVRGGSLPSLDASRPVSPSQRARAFRAIATALSMLLAAHVAEEGFDLMCCAAMHNILNQDAEHMRNDADVYKLLVAAMRTRPNAAELQLLLLKLLLQLFAPPRILPGPAEVADVLCVTISAMKMHCADALVPIGGSKLIALLLQTPVEAQLAVDVGVLSALLDVLRHCLLLHGVDGPYEALRGLAILLKLQPTLVKQHFCATRAYQAIVHVMRTHANEKHLQTLACHIIGIACDSGRELLSALAKQNADAAVSAGVMDAILAAHAMQGEACENLDASACAALCVLIRVSDQVANASFDGPVPQAFLTTLQRRLGNHDAHAIICFAFVPLCDAARRCGRRLCLPDGATFLLTRLVEQNTFVEGVSCSACKRRLAVCELCGYCDRLDSAPTRYLTFRDCGAVLRRQRRDNAPVTCATSSGRRLGRLLRAHRGSARLRWRR